MLKSFKYRLYPTENQRVLSDKHLGSARFIYNLALETKKYAYNSNKINLSRFDLSAQLVELKNEATWLKLQIKINKLFEKTSNKCNDLIHKASNEITDRFDTIVIENQTCSSCGSKYKELKLGEQEWTCGFCGTNHDRDLNAAINLKNWPVEYRCQDVENRSVDERPIVTKKQLVCEALKVLDFGLEITTSLV